MGEIAVGAADVPLEPGERVARLCFTANIPFCASTYPDQIDPDTGLIRLEEVSFSEVRRGFSMQRILLYSRKKAEEVPALRAARWQAKGEPLAEFRLVGVLVSCVADIHAIGCHDSPQIFEVLRKPHENEPAHVEVHFKARVSRDVFLEHREALQQILGRLVDAAVLDEAA